MKNLLRLWRTRNDPLYLVGIYMFAPAMWEVSGIYTNYELALASIKYLPRTVNPAHVFIAAIAKDAAPLPLHIPLRAHYPLGD